MPQTGGAINTQAKKNPKVGAASKGKARPAMRSHAAVGSRTNMEAKKKGPAKKAAVGYLTKSSGTTRGEVKGVLQAVRKGTMTKGGAIKALKGGPKAGVPAGNKKRVARAIRKAR